MAGFPLGDILVLMTLGPTYSSSVGGQSSSQMSVDANATGSESGETVGISSIAVTATASAEVSSGREPEYIVLKKKDITPYSITETKASRLYWHLSSAKQETEFPTIICENHEIANAMKEVFKSCSKKDLQDTLYILERLIKSNNGKS